MHMDDGNIMCCSELHVINQPLGELFKVCWNHVLPRTLLKKNTKICAQVCGDVVLFLYSEQTETKACTLVVSGLVSGGFATAEWLVENLEERVMKMWPRDTPDRAVGYLSIIIQSLCIHL